MKIKQKKLILLTIAVIIVGGLLGGIGSTNLVSSTLTSTLQSCLDGSQKLESVCSGQLTSEQARLSAQKSNLDKQISTKQKQCDTYKKKKQQTKQKTCNQQLKKLKNTRTVVQKELANVALRLSQLEPDPIVLTPCCPDSRATNFSTTCGQNGTISQVNVCQYRYGCTDPEALNYDPQATQNSGDCRYIGDPVYGCIDPIAENFDAQATHDDGTCTYTLVTVTQILGCMDSTAKNYNPSATIDDGSCEENKAKVPGCMIQSAHNYNPSAEEDDGSCQTCSDGIKNGDEEKVDCGGSCGKQCKKDDSQIDDSGPLPKTGYCDIPQAINYDPHSGDDDYEASSSMCTFCGNGKVEGTINDDGTIEPYTYTGQDSGVTIDVVEGCDDGNDDPYDACNACTIRSCVSETMLCREYKFSGSESKGGISSILSSGLPSYPGSRRPEWTDNTVDTEKNKSQDFSTFGAVCIMEKGEAVANFKGYHTQFGYQDSQDNGYGSASLGNACRNCTIANITTSTIRTGNNGETPTNNTTIRGVAVPIELLETVFGSGVNARKVRVQVTGPSGCFTYPIVDSGPDEYTWTRMCAPILDMTDAAAQELGVHGQSKQVEISWMLVQNAGSDPREHMTQKERDQGFSTGTFGNEYGYTYRSNTTINYPDEYFTTTRCR